MFFVHVMTGQRYRWREKRELIQTPLRAKCILNLCKPVQMKILKKCYVMEKRQCKTRKGAGDLGTVENILEMQEGGLHSIMLRYFHIPIKDKM